MVLAELIEQYGITHPDIKITTIYRETEELRNGFQNSALAGSGPELVFGPSDQVGPFATMGIVRPLEDLFDSDWLVQFSLQAHTQYEGHVYQIGDRTGNHLALVYNRDLIDKPPINSDELIRLAKEHTIDIDGDGKIDRYGLVWSFTEPYFFIPFLGGFGGWIMDENFKPTLDSEANRKALQFVIDFRDKHKVTPINCDYETADSLFKEGKAAFIINGDWSWSSYADAGINIGITRIPQISETALWCTPMISPKGYSINANIDPDKIEAVTEFVKFLFSVDSQKLLARNTGMIPTNLIALQDTMFSNNPILSNSLEQITVGRPMPVVPELIAIWDAMRPAYQGVLSGSLTADQAARQMQEVAMQKIIEMNDIIQPAE